MQIKRRNTSRKKVMLIVVAVVLLLGLTAGTLFALKLWPFTQSQNKEVNKIDLSEPSEEVKQAADATKEQTTSGDAKTDSTSDRAVAPETPAGSKAESGLRITSAMQSDSQVIIRTLIPVFTGQGTCDLSMQGPNGASYSASASVQAMASSSTCAGFNVPVSELDPGNWKVTVTLNNDKLSGSDTSEVTVK